MISHGKVCFKHTRPHVTRCDSVLLNVTFLLLSQKRLKTILYLVLVVWYNAKEIIRLCT